MRGETMNARKYLLYAKRFRDFGSETPKRYSPPFHGADSSHIRI